MSDKSITIHFDAQALRSQVSRVIERKVMPLTTDPSLKRELNQTLWDCLQRFIPKDSGALRDNKQGVRSVKWPKHDALHYGNSRINSKGIVFDAYTEYEYKKDNDEQGISAGDVVTYHYARKALENSPMFQSEYSQLLSHRGVVWNELKQLATSIIAERMNEQ